MRHLSVDDFGGIHDRIHQLFITGAAAGIFIFLEPVPDIFSGGIRGAVQQRFGRDNEARGAKAALGTAVGDPGRLDGMKIVRGTDAFHRGDDGIVGYPFHFGDAGSYQFVV